MSDENLYWLFSASAQSIAAFVALLLAGYALVHTMMHSAQAADDTLVEIHGALKRKYHSRLALLAVAAGLGIAMSLLMVFLNRWTFSGKVLLMVVTSIIDGVAIVGGLAFVISIVNPDRYRQTAEAVLEHDRTQMGLSGTPVSAAPFFIEFIRLEKTLREVIGRHGLIAENRGGTRSHWTFRQMVEILLEHRMIEEDFYGDLMQINRYRNLVFHGHLELVDEAMLERTRAAANRLDKLRQGNLT